MRTAKALIVLLLVANMAPIASAGVTVDYKKNADFRRYRTFAWAPGKPAAISSVEKQIRQAVETQLIAKGLSKASSQPDILVQILSRGRQGEVQDMDILGRESMVDPARQGPPSELHERSVLVGDLVVVLLDGHTTLQVWQAVGSRIYSDNPEKTGKKIDRMVRKMFRDYPPRSQPSK